MKKDLSLTTQCVSIDEQNNAWIFSNEFNALFHMKLDTNELRYVKSFEEEEFFCESLYTDCVRYKRKLAFIPCCAKNIAVYNIDTEEVKYIAIRNEAYIVYFNSVMIDETRVLLYPVVYSKKAYIFDLGSERLEIIELDYGSYDQQFSQYTTKPLMCGKAYVDNKAYFVARGTENYISFDLQSYKIEISQHQDHGIMYSVNANMNQLNFLLMGGSDILNLSRDGEDSSITTLFPGTKKDVNGILMTYILTSPISADVCLCVPLWNNPICVVTKEKYNLFHIDWEKINPVTGNIQPFAIVKKYGADVYLFPYQSDTLLKLNLDTREISYQRLQISLQEYVSIINNVMDVRNYCSKDGLLYEVNLPLELYLQWITDSEAKTEKSCENKGQAGKMIYDKVVQA